MVGDSTSGFYENAIGKAWLAQIIHDLRSPVTAILASSEFAQDPRSTTADLKRANDVAHRSALRLVELIDTMDEEASR